MGYFKDYLTYPAIESTNILRFHNSIPGAVVEVEADVAEDTEVEYMVVAMVLDILDEEGVMEGSMVITHMHYPEGMEHS